MTATAVRRIRSGAHIALIAAVTLSLGAGCSDTDSASATDTAGIPTISDGWGRPTPPGADNAAFYFTIDNATGTDDELVDAAASPCGRTELHLSTMSSDGVMSMAPASSEDLRLDDGAELLLEPGGLHVMCLDLQEPLVEGDEVDAELTFRNAGVVNATVTIAEK